MKRYLKKVLTVLAVTVMAAGMMACGSKETAQPVPSSENAAAKERTGTEETESRQQTQTPETESQETRTETSEPEETEHETDGMVIDAAMNSLSIMTPEGEVLLLSYPEAGADVELEDGLLLGEVIHITYTGSSEEGTAKALAITAGTTETTLDREAYEFAITAVYCAKMNDLTGLSELAAYPVYIQIDENTSSTVKMAENFQSFPREALLPLAALADYNLFDLTEAEAGIVIGDGKPNMIFSAGENGYAITGINVE